MSTANTTLNLSVAGSSPAVTAYKIYRHLAQSVEQKKSMYILFYCGILDLGLTSATKNLL